MNKARVALDLFRAMAPRNWPGLLAYFFGCAIYRICRVPLFDERELRFKSFAIVASVRGMSGLTFLHEIHNRGAYNFDDAEADTRVRHVFDAGANCGFFALHHATRHPDWHFWCFEPHPATFERLRKNIAANGLSDRIHPIQAAVGSAPGNVSIELGEGSSMAFISTLAGNQKTSGGCTVPVVTLDEIAAREQVSPDYLKIDVEGFEVEVLEGAAECLKSARHVVLEYHSAQLERDSRARLEASGFRIVGNRGELLLCSRR